MVTPAQRAADLQHAQPHQDQPINAATVWGGRVPPPSHPLSLQALYRLAMLILPTRVLCLPCALYLLHGPLLPLQALWLLDDFDYFNGATYVLPRTQQRPEHIEKWRRNASGKDLAAGLFPVRFVTGRAGDVALALGSLWHSSSSAHVPPSARASPSSARADEGWDAARWPSSARLALLFEYAPSFVRPLHRYAPAMVARLVPQQHRRLFPQVGPPAMPLPSAPACPARDAQA